jgi:hypothetical protein
MRPQFITKLDTLTGALITRSGAPGSLAAAPG